MKLPKRSLFRMRLSEAQNHRCCYCGCDMDVRHLFKRTHARDMLPNSMTVEHVRPVSKGGTNAWGNAVACCWKCNQARRADPLPVDLNQFDLKAGAPWHPGNEPACVILARRIAKAERRASA